MSTVEVNRIVVLNHKTLVIYADVAFDPAQGPYVAFWEVLEYAKGTKRDDLKSFNISELAYEDFSTVADNLTEVCDNAIVNETVYAELEGMYIDRFLDREDRYDR